MSASDGLGGYKLRVTPAKKATRTVSRRHLENFRARSNGPPANGPSSNSRSSKPNPPNSTSLGKVWQEGAQEPVEPSITFADTQPLTRERASAGAMPYAGEPVLFDDLIVTRVK